MMFLSIPSLFCKIILISAYLSLAYEHPREHYCDQATYYASNSAFSSNLNLSLRTLTNTTASTGFGTTTAGGSANQKVTALALCRATVNQSDCQLCVEAAASGIRSACPSQTSAQIWYDLCMLRYSHQDFLNKADNSIRFKMFDDYQEPASDANDMKIRKLMWNLSSSAGASEKRYAVGRTAAPKNATFYGYMTFYGYVDCTRDIDGDSCRECLLAATSLINSCCLGRWWIWIATPTCNIQFNRKADDHEDWLNNPPYVDTDITPPPALTQGRVTDTTPLPALTKYGGRVSSLTIKIAVISTVGTVLILVATVMGVGVTRRKREKVKKGGSGIAEEEIMRERIGTRNFIYDFHVLVAATDNFYSENRLGAGGFGTVYKGKLEDGEEIAVKKLTSGSTQGREEFSNEVRLLLKLHHRNLVRLLGYCVEGENRMLVYEYLRNKSLNYFLFDKNKSGLLDWPKRYNIIMGVARGLLYLHEESHLKIIHRDIKASNILLDDRMNPKIADFGIAKLFKDEQICHQTRKIVGTFGYMAPEYAIRGFMTAKIDVFSFGVLILEIISGRKNYDSQLNEQSRELLKLAWRLEQQGRIMELVDTTIGTFSQDNMLKCVRVGLLCCQKCTQDRPTMSSAMLMLSNDSVTVPMVNKHGYQDKTDGPIETHNNSNLENESFSKNYITCSLSNGR